MQLYIITEFKKFLKVLESLFPIFVSLYSILFLPKESEMQILLK